MKCRSSWSWTLSIALVTLWRKHDNYRQSFFKLFFELWMNTPSFTCHPIFSFTTSWTTTTGVPVRPTHFVGATELEKVLEPVMPKEVPNSLPRKTVSHFLYQSHTKAILDDIVRIPFVPKHGGFVFKTLDHPNRQSALAKSFGRIVSWGPIRSFARPVDKAAWWK